MVVGEQLECSNAEMIDSLLGSLETALAFNIQYEEQLIPDAFIGIGILDCMSSNSNFVISFPSARKLSDFFFSRDREHLRGSESKLPVAK